MIKTMAVTVEGEAVFGIPLEELKNKAYKWFWADFSFPDESESKLLETFFGFHALAVEDCLHYIQRAKLDFYDDFHFVVLQSLNPETLFFEEVDVFVSERFAVSFCLKEAPEIETVWRKLQGSKKASSKTPADIAYMIADELVDQYFPVVYRIEDAVQDLGEAMSVKKKNVIQKAFEAQSELLKLRHAAFPMRDLLYRIINSTRMGLSEEQKMHFNDVHDHLLKVSQIIETNLAVVANIRDSYMSLVAHQTNQIMKPLTVMSTIFMPLTFIAGLYGMNFVIIPELKWDFGYPYALGLMLFSATCTFLWFKKKGWFDK